MMNNSVYRCPRRGLPVEIDTLAQLVAVLRSKDGLLEGLGGGRVKLSLHESYEEGDMGPSTRPVPIEIDTQTQIVAVTRLGEGERC